MQLNWLVLFSDAGGKRRRRGKTRQDSMPKARVQPRAHLLLACMYKRSKPIAQNFLLSAVPGDLVFNCCDIGMYYSVNAQKKTSHVTYLGTKVQTRNGSNKVQNGGERSRAVLLTLDGFGDISVITIGLSTA